jgi:hypothetical protein
MALAAVAQYCEASPERIENGRVGFQLSPRTEEITCLKGGKNVLVLCLGGKQRIRDPVEPGQSARMCTACRKKTRRRDLQPPMLLAVSVVSGVRKVPKKCLNR